jgi:hypothetical protein
MGPAFIEIARARADAVIVASFICGELSMGAEEWLRKI